MAFDPAQHFMKLSGKQYLPARWRLVWLRTDHPEAIVETEMVHLDTTEKLAVFRAKVSIPDGGSATGYGSETEKDFKDFIEKAETKAISRAAAILGYGTEWALELDEGDRVVDGPIAKPTAQVAQRTAQPEATQVQQPPISVAQLKSILVGLLAKDPEGAGKIPKLVEDMTEAELVKTTEWLRARASRKGV